jgi:Importin-beta N-terminal domain
MSAITVEWWESICLELSRNPAGVTKTITDFRDSDHALEASKYFLQPSTGCSPVAQFQAALILQHVCLKHWNKLSASDTQDLRNTLWTLLHSSLAAGTMPNFAVNKIMQVYALLWKRGWHESDIGCKQQLFQQIRAFMQNQEYMKPGATLLRIVFEEFCSRSSAEIGLPKEFHRLAHNAFDQCGVNEGLEIAAQCLAASFSALSSLSNSPQAVTSAAATISAAAALLVEVMNWDFGNSEKFSFGLNKDSEREKQRSNDLLALPRKWSTLLLNDSFIGELFNSYQQLRTIHTHFTHTQPQGNTFSRTAESETVASLECSLSDLRLLITSLSSITGSGETYLRQKYRKHTN